MPALMCFQHLDWISVGKAIEAASQELTTIMHCIALWTLEIILDLSRQPVFALW